MSDLTTAHPHQSSMADTAGVSRRHLLGLIASGAVAAGWGSPAWAQTAPARSGYPALTSYLGNYVSSRRLPGAIAAIGRRGQAADFVAAGKIAFDSQTAVARDTLWRLYSMTKPVTGIAAMILIDQGRMQLDQPLADILPAFARMQVLRSANSPVTETVPATQAITIRHLLTHTAGLGYTIVQSGPIKAAYEAAGIVPAAISRVAIPGLNSAQPAPSLTAFADRLAQLPLVYQPGSRWSYSVALDVMGRVIEVVSGQPFDLFLKQRIFDPLKMTDTAFQLRPDQVARFATNYTPMGGVMLPIDPGGASIFASPPAFPFGGAGLVGSAQDYDRFLWMLANLGELDGERILSENAARLAMSNLLPNGTNTNDALISGAGFGAGGRVTLPGGTQPAGLFGWGGAAGTIAFVDPIRKIRFGGYANYMPPKSYDFQDHIPQVLLQDITGAR